MQGDTIPNVCVPRAELHRTGDTHAQQGEEKQVNPRLQQTWGRPGAPPPPQRIDLDRNQHPRRTWRLHPPDGVWPSAPTGHRLRHAPPQAVTQPSAGGKDVEPSVLADCRAVTLEVGDRRTTRDGAPNTRKLDNTLVHRQCVKQEVLMERTF